MYVLLTFHGPYTPVLPFIIVFTVFKLNEGLKPKVISLESFMEVSS